jgi:hypothetical protein
MNDQQDPPEQKATEQPQQTEAAVPEPEPVAAPEAAEPQASPQTVEAEAEAPPAGEETEQPEAPPQVSAQQAETPAEDGCLVEMDGFRQCGRPIYAAPAGVDERPVCLMHSKDPAKSDEEFQKEFEQILAAAGNQVADFTEFVFLRARCLGRQFAGRCVFSGAMFTDPADFVGARFTQAADFSEAKFTQDAHFSKATFAQAADFSDVTFTRGASFRRAKFTQDADFSLARFTQEAYFGNATFTQAAVFTDARFAQAADFLGATFTQDADFRGATFTQDANFFGAKFTQRAGFVRATFTQDAHFNRAAFTKGADFRVATFTQRAFFCEATFTEGADFRMATFTKDADFSGAAFAGSADFRHAIFTGTARFAPSAGGGGAEAKPCEFKDRVFFQDARFQDYADFRGPVFGESGNSTARPVFSLTRFEKPERVTFYKTWLGQTLFVNCDVSKVNFSDVEWGRCGSRRQLYEETVPLDDETAEPLKPPPGSHDERNYGLIAETYHQLKKNYDSRGDPWRANDFHYGEMEMLRLLSRFHDRWARWLDQSLFMTAWYRHLSEYGLSRGRPLAWLLLALVVFTIALLWSGLRPVPGRAAARLASLPQVSGQPGAGEELSYSRYRRFGIRDQTGREIGAGSLFLDGFATVVGIALLQRDLPYEPATRSGRLLAYAELLFTSTLAALFILAVRRQFKRGGD